MKRCLVLGSAACVWDDIEAALQIGEFDAVYAVKQMGILWPGRLDAWVTLHPDWMKAKNWIGEREARGYPPATEIIGHEQRPGITRVHAYRWPEQKTRSAASGGFGIKCALDDGFGRIVACGMPMTRNIDRIDGRKGWPSAGTYQEAFKEALPHMLGKVRSMSGWTRDMLGAPDAEWLAGSGS